MGPRRQTRGPPRKAEKGLILSSGQLDVARPGERGFARLAVAACILLIALAAAAAPARADISTTTSISFTDGAKVGTHSEVAMTLNFSYANGSADETVRALTAETPAGALGDPTSVPEAQRCAVDYTAASPQYVSCPASSKVGDVSVSVHGLNAVLGGLDLTLSGSIFLLKNRPNASPEIPGYIGIYISPPTGLPLLSVAGINLTGRITARNKTDYGLRVKILEDIPSALMSLNFLPSTQIRVNALTMRLFKLAPNGSYFATLPTRCEPWTTRTFVRSWEGNGGANADIDPALAGADHFMSSGTTNPDCSAPPPLDPAASVSSSPAKIGEPAAVTLNLTRPSAPAAIVQAHIKRVDIDFPQGVEINPALFNDAGDELCSDAEFNKSEPDAPSTCPESSAIGTLTTTTELMSAPTPGTMYLGEPLDDGANRYRAFIVMPPLVAGGMGIKFEGRVTVDADDGQIHASVGDELVDRPLPQVPYSGITLVTKGGPRSAFVNPTTCGAHGGSVKFTPWSNAAPVTRPITLNTDNGAQPCVPEGERGFDPAFAMSPDSAAAGSHDDYEFEITRPDSDQQIRDVAFDLPTGLIAAPANAAECGAAELAAAACPAASRVGSTEVAAGSGSDDFTLAGEIFNVAPQDGEVAALAAVVPAVVGPFDLGNVTLPVRLSVRDDLGASAESAPLPERVGGVAVRVHAVKVKLFGAVADGSFMRAPSRCGDHAVTARITATGGAVATRTASLQTTGCAELPFAPDFSIQPRAAAGDKNGDLPAWDLAITLPPEHAAIRALRLVFPNSVQSNLQALSPVCSEGDFQAGACPAASTLGTLRIATPLLSYPLSGKVLLVRAKPGDALPRVGLSVDAPIRVRIAGVTHLFNQNQIDSTFDDLPDLPISRIDVDLSGGPRGILQFVPARGCGTLAYSFTGQGGQTRSGAQPFGGAACERFLATHCAAAEFGLRTSGMNRRRGKRAKLSASFRMPRNCPPVRALRLTLPKGTKVNRRAAKRLASATAAGLRLRRGSVTATRRELVINNLAGEAMVVRLTTKQGLVRLAPCAKKQRCWRRKLTFTARATLADGSTVSRALAVRRGASRLR